MKIYDDSKGNDWNTLPIGLEGSKWKTYTWKCPQEVAKNDKFINAVKIVNQPEYKMEKENTIEKDPNLGWCFERFNLTVLHPCVSE